MCNCLINNNIMLIYVYAVITYLLISVQLSSSSLYNNCSKRSYGYRYPFGYSLGSNIAISDTYYRDYNNYVTLCRSQYYNCLYGPPYGAQTVYPPYESAMNVYPSYSTPYIEYGNRVTGSYPYYYGSSYYGYPTNNYWCQPCGVYYCKCQVMPPYAPNQIPKQRQEPIFLGRGSARIVDGKDVELTCYFSDPRYKVVSNTAWVKVIGEYDHWQQTPPFECFNSCTYSYINTMQDFRYRVLTMGQASILRIYNFRNEDFGIYRCTATGLSVDGSTATLYQVTEFFVRNRK